MKRPIKSGHVTTKTYKDYKKHYVKIFQNAPKDKSLSSVDQVTAFCWAAVMQTLHLTAVPLFTSSHFYATDP